MADETTEAKYKNLSKKYKIDRDDFGAQFERLTRYILKTYNYGSEIVTLAFLDLIRNGDIQAEAEEKQNGGIYRRQKGETSNETKQIGKPSEIMARPEAERTANRETKKSPEILPGQTNIFDGPAGTAEK